nr:uncharacterized protein CTRU02_13374 [Colletotrichum truncatum]KAF6783384.1 hypothetical protein CTRU02_13374 [Colletotrichum truncatum]
MRFIAMVAALAQSDVSFSLGRQGPLIPTHSSSGSSSSSSSFLDDWISAVLALWKGGKSDIGPFAGWMAMKDRSTRK